LRILYRARQFWHALNASPTSEDLALVRSVLLPAQMSAFSRLQSSEQHHAVAVLRKLKEQGETNPDLLVAALLHDVGKSQAPLRSWERALIVLTEAIAPYKVRQWGAQGDQALAQGLNGWHRVFIVAQGHPEWGARIAREAGASPLVEALIRRHQEASTRPPQSLEDRLLRKLQLADDDS
jgi:putative nucleotidyltransferase with HDIG domain